MMSLIRREIADLRPPVRRLRSLLGAGLFAAPLAAVAPAAAPLPEIWHSPCDGPTATCSTPRPSDAGLYVPPARSCEDFSSDEHGAKTARTGPIILSDADAVLERWSAASKSHLPTPDAERLRLRYARPDRSGAELELAADLQGPIDAADLTRRYEWTCEGRTADGVVLKAVPRDELDRLFCPAFRVTLDADSRPVALSLAVPAGGSDETLALNPWIDEDRATAPVTVHMAAYDAKSVHATAGPSPMIRTASLDEAPIAAPPAPAMLPPLPRPCDLPPDAFYGRILPVPEPIEAAKP